MKQIKGLLVLAGMFFTIVGAQTPETTVDVGGGITGILNKPAGATSAVLMLHGFGSQKDEVGNMYKNLATALAEQNIASLRIDFRGFGKSDGDTGSTTVDLQVEDARVAHEYLTKLEGIDPARVGVMGFSLGGGIAILSATEEPGRYKSMATWSSVGDFRQDFMGILGQPAFDEAASDGVVGLDLGWRTIVLKQDFFSSLAAHNLAEAIANYPGAFLSIAGSEDFSAAYAEDFVASAKGESKEAWIVDGGDHIYGVLGEDQSMANSVIQKTVEWFAKTL
jgi:uncharacterized protein